jgi:hypothetical protein
MDSKITNFSLKNMAAQKKPEEQGQAGRFLKDLSKEKSPTRNELISKMRAKKQAEATKIKEQDSSASDFEGDLSDEGEQKTAMDEKKL